MTTIDALAHLLRAAAAVTSCPVTGHAAWMMAGDRLDELAVQGDPHTAMSFVFDQSYAQQARVRFRRPLPGSFTLSSLDGKHGRGMGYEPGG